jgi:hypothetical protein
MKKLYSLLSGFLFVSQIVAMMCAVERPAYGYVDPGSGLLAVQILSTTFAGMIFILRRKLRSIFGHVMGYHRSGSDKVNKR